MVTYDVPYQPVPDGHWAVKSSADGQRRFLTRTDALRFAMGAALDARQHGDTAAIAIEGADGRWRLFDERAKHLM